MVYSYDRRSATELTRPLVKGYQRDLTLLLQASEAVKTVGQLEGYCKAVQTWWRRMGLTLEDGILRRLVKPEYKGLVDAAKIATADLGSELLAMLPGIEDLQEGFPARAFDKWSRKREAWIKSVQRIGAKLWKALIRIAELAPTPIETFEREEVLDVEGVPTVLVNYNPSKIRDRELLAQFKRAAHTFMSGAEHNLPELLRFVLPVHLVFGTTLGQDALYKGGYVLLPALAGNAWTLAHESGHRLFETLSSEARRTWANSVYQTGEQLTQYAGTSIHEAFAEAVAVASLRGPQQLPPKTRSLFLLVLGRG